MSVMNPGKAIGDLRRSAGISQGELAKRMGTTQSAVARLEAGRLSPSFRTMQKAFAALGRQLEVVARPATSYSPAEARPPAMVAEAEPIPYGQAALDGVDVSQIRDARRRSPDERLRYLASAARGMRRFLDSVER